MTLARGVLEIVKVAGDSTPKTFSDFTKISIGKKRLSSATVSKRLKELVAIRVLEESIIRSKTGRKIIAYRITERGKKIIELSKELESAMHEGRRSPL